MNIGMLAGSRELKNRLCTLEDAFRFSTLNLNYDKVVNLIQKEKVTVGCIIPESFDESRDLSL